MPSLLLLASCLSTSSDLERAGNDDELSVWVPYTLDTAAESADDPYASCPAAPGDSPALQLEHCLRISPEVSEEGAGSGLPGGDSGWSSGEGPLTPPCGFYNLLGGQSFSWEGGQWSGSYCDTDDDGGLWWLSVAPAEESMTRELLVPGSCLPEENSLDWTRLGESLTLAWIHPQATQDPGIYLMLDLEASQEERRVLPLEGSAAARGLTWWQEGELLFETHDDTLWWGAIDEDGWLTTPEQIGSSQGFTRLNTEEPWLMTCRGERGLMVLMERADGWTSQELSSSSCRSGRPPKALPRSSGGAWLSWEDPAGIHWWTSLDEEGRELEGSRRSLGSLGISAWMEVSRSGEEGLWLLDSTGWLWLMSDGGEATQAWRHPRWAREGESLIQASLFMEQDRLYTLAWSAWTEPSYNGHVNTYHSLELSTLQSPEPLSED